MTSSAGKTLKETLQESLDVAEWGWMVRHAARDALIVVASEMDLLETGLKIAEDDAVSVGGWINSGKLAKPTREQIETWSLDPKRKFRSLVVQPYVLIQEVVH